MLYSIIYNLIRKVTSVIGKAIRFSALFTRVVSYIEVKLLYKLCLLCLVIIKITLSVEVLKTLIVS